VPDFNEYPLLGPPDPDDTLLILDVSDNTRVPAGLVKQVTVSDLLEQVTSLPTPGGTATPGYVPIATGSGEESVWGPQSGGGGGGAVTSVFGRSAVVTAQTGDYTPSQVGADAAGAASAALTSAEAYADSNKLAKSANLSDLASVQAARDILAGAVTSGLVLRGNGTHVQLAAIQASDLPAAYVDLTSSQAIGGVKTFTGEIVVPDPVSSFCAVPKSYADAIAQGLSVKPAVNFATTAALPANTYASGVLTATGNGALSVDGNAPPASSRVLVKNEVAAANNGVYTVTATGDGSNPYVLTRSADMASGSQVPGAFTFAEAGTANAGSGWVVVGTGPWTIGVTAINWTQFSGGGTINAGTGLNKTGNTLNLTVPVVAGNLPSATTSAPGIVQLDGTAGDIQPVGTSAGAGASGFAADAAHVHVGMKTTDNLAGLASQSASRSNLGLGTAATHAATDFDAAAAAQAASDPLGAATATTAYFLRIFAA
jgi:hypothetical protein